MTSGAADATAHELGHHIDYPRSGDDAAAQNEEQKVRAGIADTFAYDFDRGPYDRRGRADGENTDGPIRNWATTIPGQPFRMADHRCNAEIHVNSTIHAH